MNCDWLFDMSVKRPHGRTLANESFHGFQTFSHLSEGLATQDYFKPIQCNLLCYLMVIHTYFTICLNLRLGVGHLYKFIWIGNSHKNLYDLAQIVRICIEVRHFENVFQQNFSTNYKHSHMTNFYLTNLLRKKTNRMIEEDFNCTSVGINTDTHATLFEIRLHLESQYKVIVPTNWRFSLYFKFIRVAQNKR